MVNVNADLRLTKAIYPTVISASLRKMSRKPISHETQAKILLECRRRCAVCFGLNRDTSIKSGQIAHLDKDSSNNKDDNLAFLCLEHHDQYDSKNSQSKGFTIKEVRGYRDELHQNLGRALEISVRFGDLLLPPEDPYAGTYIRIGTGEDSAEIVLTPLPDDPEGQLQYHVSGFAMHGAEREYGPNIGTLSSVTIMGEDGALEAYEPVNGERSHSIKIVFDEGRARFEETNEFGVYGLGVTFRGEYHRVQS